MARNKKSSQSNKGNLPSFSKRLNDNNPSMLASTSSNLDENIELTEKQKKFYKKTTALGIIEIPMTKSGFYKIKEKERHFDREKNLLKSQVVDYLGYDFDKEYAVDPKKRLKDIPFLFKRQPQEVTIPLNESIYEELVNCPKYIIKKSFQRFSGQKHQHISDQYLAVGITKNGPVLFNINMHYKFNYAHMPKPGWENYNITLYAILNGKDYFHMDRHDNLSLSNHKPKFDKDGHVVNAPIYEAPDKQQSHRHPYSIRHAVLYPSQESIGHEDRVSAKKYASKEKALAGLEKEFHFHRIFEKDVDFDNLSIEQIVSKINNIVLQKKSQNAKIKKNKQSNQTTCDPKPDGGKE